MHPVIEHMSDSPSHPVPSLVGLADCAGADGDDGMDEQERWAMTVGVAVERCLATTGRCVCGRRPSLLSRLRELLRR